MRGIVVKWLCTLARYDLVLGNTYDCPGSQYSQLAVPVHQLHFQQMMQQCFVQTATDEQVQVRHARRDVHVCANPIAEGKVVGNGDDLDPIREIFVSLSSHMFLECCRSSSAAVDFAVKQGGDDHRCRQLPHIRLHHFGRIGTSKRPTYIAGSVTDMSTYGVLTSQYIVLDGSVDERYNFC